MNRNSVKIFDWRLEVEKQEETLHAFGQGTADEAEHRHFDVSVEYVGAPAVLRVRPYELVDAVLEKALHAFGVRHEKQRFALFSESGVRLPLDLTVEAAGLRPLEKLLLRFEIFMIYNGVRKGFFVAPAELVGAVLAEGIKAFGISQAPHLLGLFTEGGVELNDKKTIAESDIKPGERLLLRPSAVRAG
jgi:hypothetical protein